MKNRSFICLDYKYPKSKIKIKSIPMDTLHDVEIHTVVRLERVPFFVQNPFTGEKEVAGSKLREVQEQMVKAAQKPTGQSVRTATEVHFGIDHTQTITLRADKDGVFREPKKLPTEDER